MKNRGLKNITLRPFLIWGIDLILTYIVSVSRPPDIRLFFVYYLFLSCVPLLLVGRKGWRCFSERIGLKPSGAFPLWVYIIIIIVYGTLVLDLDARNFDDIINVILTPIGEELFFRFYFLKELIKKDESNIWPAIIISSLCFSIGHIIQEFVWGAVITKIVWGQIERFLFGLILSLFYLLLLSIFPPMLFHMAINGYAFSYRTASGPIEIFSIVVLFVLILDFFMLLRQELNK